jgi:hypothetical protein
LGGFLEGILFCFFHRVIFHHNPAAGRFPDRFSNFSNEVNMRRRARRFAVRLGAAL